MEGSDEGPVRRQAKTQAAKVSAAICRGTHSSFSIHHRINRTEFAHSALSAEGGIDNSRSFLVAFSVLSIQADRFFFSLAAEL